MSVPSDNATGVDVYAAHGTRKRFVNASHVSMVAFVQRHLHNVLDKKTVMSRRVVASWPTNIDSIDPKILVSDVPPFYLFNYSTFIINILIEQIFFKFFKIYLILVE